MKIATWNVNGIRARATQVTEWLERDKPDVVCLQEVKAKPDQVPPGICSLAGYWGTWHCAGPYSGVGLHLRRDTFPEPPVLEHPPFDLETRIVCATVGKLVLASVYVPNGGKDYGVKVKFLQDMEAWAAELQRAGRHLVLCGDMNVTRTDADVHPKERKAGIIGQRPDERALFESVIGRGLVDVGRKLAPDDTEMYSWWAPWRNMRARNIGWRLDYVLASEAVAATAVSCPVLATTGNSDHAPVMATFEGLDPATLP